MNYDIYSHFPVLAVMLYFVGAFIVTLIGKRRTARNIVAGAVMLISLALLLALVGPVMLDGEIITYWMGDWEPAAGYAIGIAIGGISSCLSEVIAMSPKAATPTRPALSIPSLPPLP